MRVNEAAAILRDAWMRAVMGKHQDKEGHRFGEIAEAFKMGMDALYEKDEGRLVEVIRCEDCKHFNATEEIEGVSWTGFCNYGQFHTDEDDFCSRGVRNNDL